MPNKHRLQLLDLLPHFLAIALLAASPNGTLAADISQPTHTLAAQVGRMTGVDYGHINFGTSEAGECVVCQDDMGKLFYTDAYNNLPVLPPRKSYTFWACVGQGNPQPVGAITLIVFSEDSKISTLDLKGFDKLEGIGLPRGHLHKLELSGCTKLTRFVCDDNEIDGLDFTGCTLLTSLDCSNNRLESLRLDGCSSLTTIYCENNLIPVLDLHACKQLTTLRCDQNPLDLLDVSNLTQLESIFCGASAVRELKARNCTALKTLAYPCDPHFPLHSADLRNCSSLKDIAFWGCATLDVQGCTSLETIACYGDKHGQLTALKLPEAKNLTSLDIPGNALETIDVSHKPALTTFHCDHNPMLKLIDITGDHQLPKPLSTDQIKENDPYPNFVTDPGVKIIGP